ncbi:hypothetical protein HK105_202025 [Polyrhizophydium stewartii]|uniref:UBC core domain-containing protein n=1 Tax=Polyrhizophydium stewartii TaxID=2732419 RepID=A0ABR4NGF8_9FUNG
MNDNESQTSNLFRRYQLLIDKNLRGAKVCPAGVYVVPDSNNIYRGSHCPGLAAAPRPSTANPPPPAASVWHGTIFVHRGYFKEGVFKFLIEIPSDYPASIPTVRFVTDMFHPLIDREGYFNLSQQFPHWRPYKDFISHILHYIKNSFRESVISNLQEPACFNVEALRMFNNERTYFAKLAAQCAQMSSSEPILFDRDSNHIMTFTPIDETKFNELRKKLHDAVGSKE